MFYLNACPRCKGALVLDIDPFGGYISCLQCGFLRDITEPFQQEVGKSGGIGELEPVSRRGETDYSLNYGRETAEGVAGLS